MDQKGLFEQIKRKSSFLCVGLDSDIKKLPEAVRGEQDPQFAFNQAIIDATAPYAVAFKPNTAFYEERGAAGWVSLERTCAYIREKYPEILIIADAKRGDIGNTAQMYARAFFEQMDVDAVTLSPYMGSDSVVPFLEYKGKWAVILALTSNPSAAEIELLPLDGIRYVYEQVINVSRSWGTVDNTMYVVGATQASELGSIRKMIPDHFLLVPGVGAQGGSLQEVAQFGMNSRCGLLVNSSRAIIYADKGQNFAQAAGVAAAQVQGEMAVLLEKYLK